MRPHQQRHLYHGRRRRDAGRRRPGRRDGPVQPADQTDRPWLARHLGIAPEKVYCVGDNQNDIPMLELSAIPFAPANCAQEVKDWGARVLCHCGDGVIGGIVEILDGLY